MKSLKNMEHPVMFHKNKRRMSLSHKKDIQDKESFSALFEKFPVGLEGSLVEGVVIAIKKNVITLSFGLKSTMTIPMQESSVFNLKNVQIGDCIPFVVDMLETQDGEMVLNHEKAIKEIKHQTIWRTIKRNRDFINGLVLNHVEGGFGVGIGGIVAFLPKDDVPPIKQKKRNKRIPTEVSSNSFVGSVKTFRVMEMRESRTKKSIVLSRTEAIKNMIRLNRQK